MADRSAIEWTDATWNPVTGCTKVSAECKHCYAERLWPRAYPGRAFTDVQCHPERLDQPLRWKKPRRVFVNSMSDLFHDQVPFEWVDRVFTVMALAPQHAFQVLTKRPKRMLAWSNGAAERIREANLKLAAVAPSGWVEYGAGNARHSCWWRDSWAKDPLPTKSGTPWPLPNVWLGVSVEDQATADERIPLLLQTPTAVRFVSYEPALGPVDFANFLPPVPTFCHGEGSTKLSRVLSRAVAAKCGMTCIDWIIAGGESGPHARPAHPDWFRSVRDQCQAAGVPFFFKQWGEWAPWANEAHFTHGGEERHAHAWIDRNGEGGACWIVDDDGSWSNYTGTPPTGPDGEVQGTVAVMGRHRKKSSGCLLDGRTHDETPTT